MLYKGSLDRRRIDDAHQHCVEQQRSLSHEFDALTDLFSLRTRDPLLRGQPRKYLLRHIERPLVRNPRPHRFMEQTRRRRQPQQQPVRPTHRDAIVVDDTDKLPAVVDECATSETEIEEDEDDAPLERITLLNPSPFAQYDRPVAVPSSLVVNDDNNHQPSSHQLGEFDRLIEWDRQCEQEKRVSEEELVEMEVERHLEWTQHTEQVTEMQLLFQSREYEREMREPDPQQRWLMELDADLRTIQTLQIVCHDNTIYCQ